ncbi:hypothetical protein HDU80_005903 [Chytriomyces hyalinus]|nr:hypothetical protein HDU80_005903 [Chytriomyces hyalinus]
MVLENLNTVLHAIGIQRGAEVAAASPSQEDPESPEESPVDGGDAPEASPIDAVNEPESNVSASPEDDTVNNNVSPSSQAAIPSPLPPTYPSTTSVVTSAAIPVSTTPNVTPAVVVPTTPSTTISIYIPGGTQNAPAANTGGSYPTPVEVLPITKSYAYTPTPVNTPWVPPQDVAYQQVPYVEYMPYMPEPTRVKKLWYHHHRHTPYSKKVYHHHPHTKSKKPKTKTYA